MPGPFSPIDQKINQREELIKKLSSNFKTSDDKVVLLGKTELNFFVTRHELNYLSNFPEQTQTVIEYGEVSVTVAEDQVTNLAELFKKASNTGDFEYNGVHKLTHESLIDGRIRYSATAFCLV